METIEFLNIEFFENTLKDYLVFLLFIVFGYIIIIPVKSMIIKILFKFFGKDHNDIDTLEFKNLLNKPLQYFLILILFFFSLKFINIPTFLTSSEEGVDISVIATKGFNFLLLTTVFWVILRSIDFVGFKLKNKALETESNVLILKDVFKVMSNYKSKLILYTYDSFTFDFNISKFNKINIRINN